MGYEIPAEGQATAQQLPVSPEALQRMVEEGRGVSADPSGTEAAQDRRIELLIARAERAGSGNPMSPAEFTARMAGEVILPHATGKDTYFQVADGQGNFTTYTPQELPGEYWTPDVAKAVTRHTTDQVYGPSARPAAIDRLGALGELRGARVEVKRDPRSWLGGFAVGAFGPTRWVKTSKLKPHHLPRIDHNSRVQLAEQRPLSLHRRKAAAIAAALRSSREAAYKASTASTSSSAPGMIERAAGRLAQPRMKWVRPNVRDHSMPVHEVLVRKQADPKGTIDMPTQPPKPPKAPRRRRRP